MIDIPGEVYDDVFEVEIKRGTIVKTPLLCHDGSKEPHYHVTISYCAESDPLVFVVCTSNLTFYNKYPYFNSDILRIPAGKIDCLPLNTIVDCRKIRELSREKLKKNYREGILNFSGELPTEDLCKIDDIIRKSRFISPKDKELILGQNYRDTLLD